MNAKTIKGSSPKQISAELSIAMSDGFTPTLGVVFLSIKQDRKQICRILSDHNVSIYGVTTAGEFIDGEVGEESTAILLLDINRKYFVVDFKDSTVENAKLHASEIGKLGLTTFSNPAFIVSGSGVTADGEKIIRGIEEAVGKDVVIFGGMAGDDFTMTGTFVFTNEKDSGHGIVAIIFDADRVKLNGIATCGWKSIGIVRTVTKSDGCWVYTIDNEPALDMIIKYMGIPHLDKDKKNEVILNIGANFPLQMQVESGSSVMRTAMLGNWSENSFMCAGNVPQGSKIRFTIPADFEVIDQIVSECAEIKERSNFEADAMLLFSCKARHIALGPLISKEIEGLRNVWNAPMAGFFTYGEFGRSAQGRQEFHNITCCWVAISEVQ
jgi:hypothetical protein